MIVGEAPGADEVSEGAPFVGASGRLLNELLAEAGLSRDACFVTNVCRHRPPGNDIDLWQATSKRQGEQWQREGDWGFLRFRVVRKHLADGYALLREEIAACRPRLIIALGGTALYALTGKEGISNWRGSALYTEDGIPVLPTLHPASVLRQWESRWVAGSDLKRAKRFLDSGAARWPEPVQRFTVAPSLLDVTARLHDLLRRAAAGPLKLAPDIEVRAGQIDCIGIAWSKHDAICIPLTRDGGGTSYWPEAEEAWIVHLLFRLLTHPNVLCVGQNFSYDAQWIHRQWHFLPARVRDTMIAQHAMLSTSLKSLAFLSSMYCEEYCYWKDELHGDDTTRWAYNCKDCVRTYEVDEGQQRAVDAMGLRVPHDFQQSLFFPVLRMMLKGVRYDDLLAAEYRGRMLQMKRERQEWFEAILGHPINLGSPTQLVKLLYDDLAQQKCFNRGTKGPTTDDEALRKIAKREPLLAPLVTALLEYRSLGVYTSNFLAAQTDLDERMRCSFNIAGTDTYRFSSSTNAFDSGLNLQNLPKDRGAGDIELPNIRSLYLPDSGHTLFDIDLASADLRIVVWESDERVMKEMLAEGLDPYTEIAKEYYHDRTLTKADPRRQKFKAFAHGTHYLGTPTGLAASIGLSAREVEETQAWYFSRFPRIKEWQEAFKEGARRNGYIQNVFGHRRYILERFEGNLLNRLIAWLPQSTVGILINHALVRIDAELPQVQLLLQVHDSLVGQFPTDGGESTVEAIVRCAEVVLPYADPLVIPVGVKTSVRNWGECE